jgi:hypothetical protein
MSQRTDTNNEPTKEVRLWNGIPLNITTKTGEPRFSFAPPMTCDYGCIRGTWGAGLDGKALDVYVVSDTPTVFKVVQIKPDTHEIDEYKYILGANNLSEATKIFLTHVPQRFLGGVKESSINELNQDICKNKPNSDSANNDYILILANSLVELLEDDEAYGSDLNVLAYTIKANNDITGVFRDSWNNRIFDFIVNSSQVGYKPKIDTDVVSQFDSFSAGYSEKLDAPIRKTKKPKCTGISYSCGQTCITLKNTCWIKTSGAKIKRSKISRGAVVSISQGRIDKIRALADTMRKNKTSISWHIGSVYSLEHKASQLERERARLFASQKKNT